MPELSQLTSPPLGRTVSRTDLVEEALRDWILTGQLRSGQQLVERELSEVLGMSKTPVREALIILSRRGLVESNTYHGMTVRKVTAQMIRSVQQARVMVEPEVVAGSLSRLTSTDIVAAKSALDRSQAAVKEQNWAAVASENRSFHRALYGRHENELLVSFLDQLQDQITLIALTSWEEYDYPTQEVTQEATQHRKLLAAVERGDSREVRKLVKTHLQVLSKFADHMTATEAPRGR